MVLISQTYPYQVTALRKINGKTIDYTPDATFAGNDIFNYTISDGHGGTSSASVIVTVLSANDPPETPEIITPKWQ